MVTDVFVAVIDDDRALRCALVDLMRSAGYRVESFVSGEMFLVSPELQDFNYVIADIDLPGMNGLDLARRFKRAGGAAPLVLITALTDCRLSGESIAAGAKCLLRKPFDSDVLLGCIEKERLA
jgi:FixJ family two-component response regulator